MGPPLARVFGGKLKAAGSTRVFDGKHKAAGSKRAARKFAAQDEADIAEAEARTAIAKASANKAVAEADKAVAEAAAAEKRRKWLFRAAIGAVCCTIAIHCAGPLLARE